MKMDVQITTTKLYLVKPFVLFICQLTVFTHIKALPIVSYNNNTTCESSTTTTTTSQDNTFASGFHCNHSKTSTTKHCDTFAILRANSRFSSLSNLSSFLGIDRFAIAEANGFSTAETDRLLLPKDRPLLVPIGCECESDSGLFRARFVKSTTTVNGESLSEIVDSLEGLTTCKAIVKDKASLVIPIPCACPSSEFAPKPANLFLTYPVAKGDTLSNLAFKFNTSEEAIVSANNNIISLKPFTSLLIPVSRRPGFFGSAIPTKPGFRLPRKKKSKMRRIGLYVALGGVSIGVVIAVAVALFLIQVKNKKQKKSGFSKGGTNDLELQQLSLSVRTIASDKKVSFEGSNHETLDGSVVTTTATPRKPILETFAPEEIVKATEDFSPGNHIEGSVYHGRLNGKNLAVKRVNQATVSRIDFTLFGDSIHRHPNILRLLGTCLNEDPDHSFLVFEYAKNGTLKDWLHGGLAIKSQFIASCYCFLTWHQRLRICLDVASALQFMHHVMEPRYVHGNIKSRNVFLDEEFNAKLGNFGFVKQNEEESSSFGYSAPERVVSPSSDIFAFGVVLLEALSGPGPASRPDEKVRLVLDRSESEVREWMDKALGESYCVEGAVAAAELGRACTEADPASRPTAEEVVERLARLVSESPPEPGPGECSLVSESSSKPLVKAN